MCVSLTLLTPFHLLDLVHGALENVALVGLDTETCDVAHVRRQQLSQLLDVAALQFPSPLLQAAGGQKNTYVDNHEFQTYKPWPIAVLKIESHQIENVRVATKDFSPISIDLLFIFIN